MKNKIFSGFSIVQDLIKLRWVPEILQSIDNENYRYGEILNSIPYMSHTELNRKLSMLVDKKVIERIEDEQVIEYKLLEFGEDLIHIFYHLEDLEERYIKTS